MKGFVILVIVLAIGFIIYAAGRKREAESKKAVQQQREKNRVEQVVKEVQDTAGYAIGAPQVKAGNRAKGKIQQIQESQNKRNAAELQE